MGFPTGHGLRRRLADLVLKKFDSYCAEHERTMFDQETVEAWVTAQLATSGRYRSWMSYIRDLGRFLRAHGYADAYVLSDRWKAAFMPPPRPYLLTAEEIDAFFTAAARLTAASPATQWQASAFFTLMHSSGLRTCEVRGLLVEYVDVASRHIDVMSSKSRRSRGCQSTNDVADVLAACEGLEIEYRGRSGNVLHLLDRQSGHGRHSRGDVQPDLGCRRPAATGERTASPALRFPAPFRLRQHRTVDGRRHRRGRDVAVSIDLHGPRDGRVDVPTTSIPRPTS